MKEALEILEELTGEDVNWIFSQGIEWKIKAGESIIREGELTDSIFIILQGLLGVKMTSVTDIRLSSLGAGEVVGDMTYLENQPANVTVYAVEDSLIMVLSHDKVDAKLKHDTAFAKRYYRSLAIINSRRLRQSVGTLGINFKAAGEMTTAMSEKWGAVVQGIQNFKALLQKADNEALRRGGIIPEKLNAEIRFCFRNFCRDMNMRIGNHTSEPESVKAEVGKYVKLEILPYLLLTEVTERLHSKPRGYACDYLTVQKIYDNQAGGSGRIGPLLDRCFLDEPAARAMRNRRRFLGNEIMDSIAHHPGTTRVTNLACGPAAEIFDAFNQLDDSSKLAATLLDIDMQALRFVINKVEKLKLKSQIHPICCNLVYFATGMQKLNLNKQDLVYSTGIIDYFNDKFVVAIINYVYDILNPGGRIILSNFHNSNTTRALMDHVLDWKLIHRSEEEMDCLFSISKFGKPATRIYFEEEGIIFFAECIKA